MRMCSLSRQAGFTFVELVVVIILIGALSALGVSLFARSSSYSPLLAAQQLESAALLAQQAALAGNINSRLVISVSGDEIDFSAAGSDFAAEHRGTEAEYRRLSRDGSVSPWQSVDGLEVPFDALGNIGDPFAGQSLEFRITNESEFSVCLNALGSLYRAESCP